MWLSAFLGLLILLPETLAVILAIALVFGHVAGAYTWMVPAITVGWYQTVNGLFLATAILLGVGVRYTVRSSVLRPEQPGAKMSPVVRWGLIVLLVGVCGGMIFAPW